MYNQTGNLYKGVFDCLYKTVTTEGVLAIYKGYFAHLARILPHTVRPTPSLQGFNLANRNM
jgi:solute carrier family 25 protein 34/35